MLEDVERGMVLSESKAARWEVLMDRWQEIWQGSVKGRVTYAYCEDVRERVAAEWTVSHGVCQVLTGHGNFKQKLTSFNLVENEICESCEVERPLGTSCISAEGLKSLERS